MVAKEIEQRNEHHGCLGNHLHRTANHRWCLTGQKGGGSLHSLIEVECRLKPMKNCRKMWISFGANKTAVTARTETSAATFDGRKVSQPR